MCKQCKESRALGINPRLVLVPIHCDNRLRMLTTLGGYFHRRDWGHQQWQTHIFWRGLGAASGQISRRARQMRRSTVEISGEPNLVPATDIVVRMEREGREVVRLSCSDTLMHCTVATQNPVAFIGNPAQILCS